MKKLNLKRLLNLRSFALAGILLVAVFAVSCDKADDGFLPAETVELKDGHLPGNKPDVSPDNRAPKPGDQTIAEIVVASTEAEEPQFTLLLAALEYAGLTSVFAGTDQYTVFAPTDQAFLDLVDSTGVDPSDPFTGIDELLGEGTVANVLLYHVTEGRRAANSVVPKNGPREIETLLEVPFYVNPGGSICAVPGTSLATIVSANNSASNGIIHVIDGVLIPPSE
jgi:uncharacterized surface protein with fasciclin (FAS1) repeats